MTFKQWKQRLGYANFQKLPDYDELPAANGLFKPSPTEQKIMDLLNDSDRSLHELYKCIGSCYLRALNALQEQGIVTVYIHILRKKKYAKLTRKAI